MAEEIEKLVVTIESDISKLLSQTAKGVDQAEDELKKLEKTGKQAFKKTGDEAKKATGIIARFGRVAKQSLDKLKSAATAVGAALTLAIAGITTIIQLAEEAVSRLRVEAGFRQLARQAGESSDEIIRAMTEAAGNTIDKFTLMQKANVAMQLGVARTPEEFAKLTESAIKLGRAVGLGPVEALDNLINAAGRRSTEVLDNLGISLAEVNQEMEAFAQREFGQAVGQLDQAQRNAAFMAATLDVAAKKADQLGDSVSDLGTSIEQAKAQSIELKQELGETALIVLNSLNRGFQNIFGQGILERAVETTKAWQRVLIDILIIIGAIGAEFINLAKTARDVVTGQIDFGKALAQFAPGEILADFQRAATIIGAGLKEEFQQILDPEGFAAESAGVRVGQDFGAGLEEGIEDGLEAARGALDSLGSEFIDLQEDTNQKLQELNEDHAQKVEEINTKHQDKLTEIAADAARKRVEAQKKADDALRQLAEDTARQRAEILQSARLELAKLEADTDRQLEDERESFEVKELRETEDHLQELRRLRNRFIDDLETAAKNRDARAIVDLRRRFQREQQESQTGFRTTQQRERQDQDRRLAEIREAEQVRAAEIVAARERDLQALIEAEAQKREEISRTLNEELVKIDEQEVQKVERENKAFEERVAREEEQFAKRKEELNKALADRLEDEAKALADQEEITEEGAKAILEALNKTFGVGGNIDQLMEDFANRRRQKFRISVEFEESVSEGPTTGPRPPTAPGSTPVPSFADGGTLIARKPTLAMFGEAGPEVASFMPLNQMQQSATVKQTKRVEIDLNFKGSAPPGIRGAERDQIANVLIQAFRQAGVMQQ